MKRCHIGFDTLTMQLGQYMTCCPPWTSWQQVYPEPYKTPQEIWDHPNFVKLREHWEKGDPSLCLKCPLYVTQDKHAFQDQELPPVRGGAPTRIYVANEGQCNLHCWSCRDKIHGPSPRLEQRESDLWQCLWTWRESIEWLSLACNGEVFHAPMYRRLLQMIRPEDFPKARLELYTNGLLLPDRWHEIAHLHSRVDQITMSIDASSKEIYEQVRAPAKWEQLIRAMEFIRDLREKGLPNYYCVFVTRRANMGDVGGFVDLCKAHKATKIRFTLFDRIWHSPEQYENEVLRLEDLAKILEDPRLSQSGVDCSVLRAAASGRECWA